MSDIEKIQLFEGRTVRSVWVESEEKWYFVIEDVIKVLTDSQDPKQYVKRMKLRDPELAKGWVQIVPLLSIITEGGPQKMRCANAEGLFRIIQSIPSKKAEPFKQWMARVASERIDEIQDPELAILRGADYYRAKGYSEGWIHQRLQSIRMRKELTDEWKARCIDKEKDFAILTNDLTKAWSGLTVREYKDLKGLKKENLRDNMTNAELVINMLGELATTEISKTENPQGFEESKIVARDGGNIAGNALRDLEERTGRKVVSSKNSKNPRLLDENLK
jgi:hypothetical protein